MQNIISVNNEVEYMEKYYKLVNIVERYLFNNCFNRNNIKIKQKYVILACLVYEK